MDHRDTPTWVVLELSALGEERLLEGTLEGVLRSDLGVDSDYPIFIPASVYYKGSRRVALLLLEGYVFVRSGLSDVNYFRLERKSYIERVLTQDRKQGRVIQTVSHPYILDLQRQLRNLTSREIPLGSRVKILEGSYRNLRGTVTEIQDGDALVYVVMRSFEMLLKVPRVLLEEEP